MKLNQVLGQIIAKLEVPTSYLGTCYMIKIQSTVTAVHASGNEFNSF